MNLHVYCGTFLYPEISFIFVKVVNRQIVRFTVLILRQNHSLMSLYPTYYVYYFV